LLWLLAARKKKLLHLHQWLLQLLLQHQPLLQLLTLLLLQPPHLLLLQLHLLRLQLTPRSNSCCPLKSRLRAAFFRSKALFYKAVLQHFFEMSF
jgi:hypothetical protein